jgi:aspartyl-tRNA(Asn)/glutamyl-tRNA(Gln) amidotransferase subunit B
MRCRFVESYELARYDAEVLTADRNIAKWFDIAAQKAKSPKIVANWIISELLRLLGETGQNINECKITPDGLAELTNLITDGKISGKIAKTVFAEMFESGKSASAIVEASGLSQVSDAGAIAEVCKQAVEANAKQVAEYRAGNPKVLQFFVGQVMKLSKGRANPQLAVTELKKLLDEE